MHTHTTYAYLLIPVLACSVPSNADPMRELPDEARMESTIATEGIDIGEAMGSLGVGAAGEQHRLDVTGIIAAFTGTELWAEPGYFLRSVLFPTTHRRETATPLVPEPSTWILVLLGLGILLAAQRSVPVNLRTVHSRLRARRGHVPTR